MQIKSAYDALRRRKHHVGAEGQARAAAKTSTASLGGTPNRDGWYYLDLPDGSTLWRPAGYPFLEPPERWRWHDLARKYLPYSEPVKPTHPSREKRVWDEGQHRFIDEEVF